MKLIAFNKPFGVLSQFRSLGQSPTLADYLPQRDIYPAGRLDKDSEGLLLLTDYGPWQHRISDPRHKLPKTYWVQVENHPTEQAIRRLQQGVLLNDGMTRPAQVETIAAPAIWPRHPPIRYRAEIPTSWLQLTIREGRNRQVRRMTAAVGFPTLRLIRVAIGPWPLADLTPGQWCEVTAPAEWQKTQASASVAKSAHRSTIPRKGKR